MKFWIAGIVWLWLLIGGVYAQQSLPLEHPKYRTVKRVFDDLVRAIGDGRTKPALYMQPLHSRARMKVAWFEPRKTAIGIEERVYDLCVTLGADSLNALASLMGHELAHYYKDHGWVGEFGSGFADLDVGQTLKGLRRDPAKLVEFETEADYFGGFFGYVAGYNTLDVAPRVLDTVYEAYNISANLRGYPSLGDRKAIAERSRERLAEMIPVFDAGNALLILKQYREAAQCFDYIARTFPSREILNNAGVARALEALTLSDPSEIRFAYPLELDASTRLSQGEGARGEGDKEHRTQLLQEALEAFEKAKARDPNYATAYVNIACVYDLKGEHEMAAVFAGKGAKLAKKNEEMQSLANAMIARGIAQANGDPADEDAAREDFEAAQKGNAALAGINLGNLSGGMGYTRAGEEKPPSRRESIGEVRAGNTDVLDPPDATVEMAGAGNQSDVVVYAKQTDAWQGIYVETENRGISLVLTPPGYSEKSEHGIKIGSSLKDVKKKYGEPARLVPARQGNYHVYQKAKIAFLTDGDDRVTGWMIFAVESF